MFQRALIMFKSAIKTIRRLDDFFYSGRKTKKILFVLTDGYGFACQAPVIKELLHYKDVHVSTTLDHEQPVDNIGFSCSADKELFLSLVVPTAKAALMKWNFVVDTHQNPFYPKRNALRVYMHHGTGFGATGTNLPTALSYQLYFGLSKVQKSYFEKLSPGIFDTERAFFSVGSPKTDEFAQSKFSRTRLLDKYGLEDRPTILITSHWNGNSTLSNFGTKVIEKLAESRNGYNIIQTGHPWLWSANKHVDKNFQQKLLKSMLKVETTHNNTKFLPDAVVFELLYISDLLIADQSSVITTYSLLDRPIVFFDNPYARKEKIGVKEIIDTYRSASHQFTSMDDLLDACEEAIKNPETKASGRKAMRETFSANVGKSCLVAADILKRSSSTFSVSSGSWKDILELSHQNMNTQDNISIIS